MNEQRLLATKHRKQTLALVQRGLTTWHHYAKHICHSPTESWALLAVFSDAHATLPRPTTVPTGQLEPMWVESGRVMESRLPRLNTPHASSTPPQPVSSVHYSFFWYPPGRPTHLPPSEIVQGGV